MIAVIALFTAVCFTAAVIIWRVRYRRWLARGREINSEFALWSERRRELDPKVARLEQLSPDQQVRVRSDVAYYMRWSDYIIAKQDEWNRSAP